MTKLESCQRELSRKKLDYKENIKNGIKLQHEIKELKDKVSRLEKGMESVLPVGTKILFKDLDDQETIQVVIVEKYDKQTFLLLSNNWNNQELSKWYLFDYDYIYSDNLIEDFCNEYNVELIEICKKCE